MAAGVEVRRYTPKDTTTKDYYVEVPFEVDVDGPFYSVLNFFDRLQKLERIVNVGHLTMGALKGGKTGVKKTYTWSPNETVARQLHIDDVLQHFQGRDRRPLQGEEVGGAMKISTLILAIWLAASAWAQTPAAETAGESPAAAKSERCASQVRHRPAREDAARMQSRAAAARRCGTAFTRSEGEADTPVQPRIPAPSVVQSVQPGPGSRHHVASGLARRIAVAERQAASKGERDPFVSPIVERQFTAPTVPAAAGSALWSATSALQGVVRTPAVISPWW